MIKFKCKIYINFTPPVKWTDLHKFHKFHHSDYPVINVVAALVVVAVYLHTSFNSCIQRSWNCLYSATHGRQSVKNSTNFDICSVLDRICIHLPVEEATGCCK